MDFITSTVPDWAAQERHIKVVEMRMTIRQVRVISPERVKRLFETIGFNRLRIVGFPKPDVVQGEADGEEEKMDVDEEAVSDVEIL